MVGCLGYLFLVIGAVFLYGVLASSRPDKGDGLATVGFLLVTGVVMIVVQKLRERSVSRENATLAETQERAEARVRAEVAAEERARPDRASGRAGDGPPITFKCPRCGGVGRAPAGSRAATCRYCGSAVDVSQ